MALLRLSLTVPFRLLSDPKSATYCTVTEIPSSLQSNNANTTCHHDILIKYSQTPDPKVNQ